MVLLSYGAKGEKNVNRGFNSLIKKMGEKDKALAKTGQGFRWKMNILSF